MSHNAVIPEEVIARLVELTKTEIIILVYLYKRRNRKTGQCNPKRATIARDTGINKSHVTVGFRNLQIRGWVIEQEGGNLDLAVPLLPGKTTLPFHPKRRTKKVAHSATFKEQQKLPIPQPEVTECATFLNDEKLRIPQLELPNAQLFENSLLISSSEQRRNNVFTETSINEKIIVASSPTDDKSENSKAQKSKRGTRIAEPFLLTKKMIEWATDRRPDVDPKFETEIFVNYWRGKSGAGGTKLDWLATWRNWILRAKPSKNGKYTGNGSFVSAREQSGQRSRSQRERLEAILNADQAE